MNIFKNGMGYGFALGLGATALLPIAARIVGTVAKPLLKETIKGGMYVYTVGSSYAAGAKETLEDLSAEARNEMKQDEQPAKTAQTKESKTKSSSGSSSSTK